MNPRFRFVFLYGNLHFTQCCYTSKKIDFLSWTFKQKRFVSTKLAFSSTLNTGLSESIPVSTTSSLHLTDLPFPFHYNPPHIADH